MSITHSTTKLPGDRGYADDWNADHIVTDESKPKNFTTLIVAASNSLDTTRADYVCDGVDDQDEINAAITALPVQGGRVSLLEGTYQITDSIVFDKDNVTLQGVGIASRIQTVEDIKMLTATSKSDIGIMNLWIEGIVSQLNNYAVWFETTDNVLITECLIQNSGATNIFFSVSTKNTIISNNFILSAVRIGVAIASSSKTTIENNIISDNGNEGIAVSNSENILINSNLIKSNGFDGILLFQNSNNSAVVGNVCTDNGLVMTYSGIHLADSNGCTVIGNISYNNGFHGIELYDFDDSSINGNTTRNNAHDGMNITNTDNSIFSANRSGGNGGYGVNIVDVGSDNNIVVSNNLLGNTTGSLSDSGTGTEAAHNKI